MTQAALITGITGQDGAYLAELLLEKGYAVSGLLPRRSSDTLVAPARARPRERREPDRRRRAGLERGVAQHPRQQGPRGLQPGRPVLRRHVVAAAGAHGEFTGVGAANVLEAIRLTDPAIRFYQASSSEMFGKCRPSAAERDDAVLPAQPVRRGQGLRPLDHGQLPRELRPVRLHRHPVQPRVAAPRHRVRDAQGHRRRGPHQARPAEGPAPRQPRRQARLGLRRRLRRRDVADAAAGRSPTTTSSRPATRRRCASCAASRSRTSACRTRTTW